MKETEVWLLTFVLKGGAPFTVASTKEVALSVVRDWSAWRESAHAKTDVVARGATWAVAFGDVSAVTASPYDAENFPGKNLTERQIRLQEERLRLDREILEAQRKQMEDGNDWKSDV